MIFFVAVTTRQLNNQQAVERLLYATVQPRLNIAPMSFNIHGILLTPRDLS